MAARRSNADIHANEKEGPDPSKLHVSNECKSDSTMGGSRSTTSLFELQRVSGATSAFRCFFAREMCLMIRDGRRKAINPCEDLEHQAQLLDFKHPGSIVIKSAECLHDGFLEFKPVAPARSSRKERLLGLLRSLRQNRMETTQSTTK